VVLETSIEYTISIGVFSETERRELPLKVDSYKTLGRTIESVQLGALISEPYQNSEAIFVAPTWRYIHNPFDIGFIGGWSTLPHGKGFMPKTLNEAESDNWGKFAVAICKHRQGKIDVAINRTLRAMAERLDFMDVMVDAVIAWENLFAKSGESTLRVSGSLAWLLKETPADREKLRSEVAAIYKSRSAIVHGNASSSSSQDRYVAQANRALVITVDALRALFTRRRGLLVECADGAARSNRLLMGG
jgi:hypothetical protein